MNIVEAFKSQYKQFIILLSGFSGSGKSLLGKSLVKDINKNKGDKSTNFVFLNLNDFYKDESEYNKIIEVGELKVVDWDDPEAVDWEKFNMKINEIKSDGVVVSGFAFPKDKLNFNPDFHIHIKISKDDLIKNRHEFTQEKLDDKTSRVGEIGEDMEKRILNKITFPHYLKSLESSVMNKVFFVQQNEIKKVYDEMFLYLMNSIEKKLK
jgi:tRNA A37 threonylcarbamoyladenosine biosynthesis protein TsaE